MSFPKKIYIKAIVFLIFVALFFLLALGLSSYFSFRDSTKYGIITIFLLGYLFHHLNNKIVNWIYLISEPKLDQEVKNIKNGKRGYEGEDEVNLWLEDIVGKDNIIRNVKLPNYKFDIDSIIISDKGLTAIEIKNFSKNRHFEDNNYFYEDDNGNRYPSSYEDPRNELNRHTNGLIKYLSDNELGFVKINKIVVFANGKVSWDGKTGIFIARDKESLKDHIESLTVDNNCMPEVCEKIKLLLKKYSKF